MHISEGILSLPVLGAGWAAGAAALALGLKKTAPEAVVKTALVGAALFLCSLVRVPLGAASIHLTLLGLAGYLLGFSALPALFVALLLQALLFQFGGIMVLGVNLTIMGGAALAGFGMRRLFERLRFRAAGAFCAGFFAILTGASGTALALAASSRELRATAALILAANVPLALAEGVITLFIVLFLTRRRPDAF